MIDSGDYFWLSAEQHVGLGEAGCVTVVSGSTNEAALAAFGVEPEAAVVPIGPAAMQVAPNLAGVSSLGDGGVLIVEPNGFQGARHEVLRRVSKKGVAASVQWGVNGSVYVGCARKGRVICLVDLLLDDDLPDVPARLKQLVPHDRIGADLIAVGAAMAVTFAGLNFDDQAVAEIAALRVLSPVLADLDLKPPSLSMLRYDAPELLARIVAADGATHRALAEWSAMQAVQQADLAADERVREIVAQFGVGRPSRLTAGLNELAQLAERECALAEARDPFRRPDQGAGGLVYTWAWQRKSSVEALRYCCEPDPLIAVIGAVEAAEACANINGAGPEFTAEAARLLNLDPGSWAHERSPLPDPPTAEQRADQLKNELTRIAEFEAAEKPWSLELPDDTWTV